MLTHHAAASSTHTASPAHFATRRTRPRRFTGSSPEGGSGGNPPGQQRLRNGPKIPRTPGTPRRQPDRRGSSRRGSILVVVRTSATTTTGAIAEPLPTPRRTLPRPRLVQAKRVARHAAVQCRWSRLRSPGRSQLQRPETCTVLGHLVPWRLASTLRRQTAQRPSGLDDLMALQAEVKVVPRPARGKCHQFDVRLLGPRAQERDRLMQTNTVEATMRLTDDCPRGRRTASMGERSVGAP